MVRSHRAPRATASGRRGTPWRAAGLVLAALLAITGSGVIAGELTARPLLSPPPQPVPAQVPPQPPPNHYPLPQLEPPDDELPSPAMQGMPASRPVEVRIPQIDVTAEIMDVGIGEDGMVEVPPLEEAQLAGWYDRGPTPGEVGNSVVVGHVDSYAIGPAVFFELGALAPGDLIEILREDGSLATFEVDGLATYPKTEFPNELIYGPSDRASLRLVTCGGEFDPRAEDYPDNVVVFSTLVGIEEPGRDGDEEDNDQSDDHDRDARDDSAADGDGDDDDE